MALVPGERIEMLLERIGELNSECKPNTAQARSLRIAAFALMFVERRGLIDELDRFINEADGPLSDDQNELLRRMGIDPRSP